MTLPEPRPDDIASPSRRTAHLIVVLVQIVALLGAVLLAMAVAFAQGAGCTSAPENFNSPSSCYWVGISAYTAVAIAIAGIAAAVVGLSRRRWLGSAVAATAWIAAVAIAAAIVVIGDARY